FSIAYKGGGLNMVTRAGLSVMTVVLVSIWFLASAGLSFAEKSAFVRYVIDGDTIVLKKRTKVRYRGINSPEIPHKNKPGESLGWAATKRNRQLVRGRLVRLVQDDEKKDRFGRLLAYVFLPDGRMVNEILVREGMAFVCFSGKGSPFNKRLLAAQREAINAGRGIWSIPPVRPEPYYVGNRQTLRFHRPSCPYGKKISKTNRIIFKSRNNACKEGFCRCKKCLP
ncbi:MAG: thermonuclease family protein, partial [Thermodesulfobacteriota bacterium]|nr:thermonuclease family protein [Thermodesulfobacteriota bacterium]